MEELSVRFGDDNREYIELAERVKEAFNNRFWNEEKQCLYDVVDIDDDKIRPNQIWAVSLPFAVLDREKEKKIVSYHEAGHALVSDLVGICPIQKISIVPRGQALGYVLQLPDEDRYIYTKDERKKMYSCST